MSTITRSKTAEVRANIAEVRANGWDCDIVPNCDKCGFKFHLDGSNFNEKDSGEKICDDCEEEEILLECFKCEKKYMGVEGNCCCGKCCSYCKEPEVVEYAQRYLYEYEVAEFDGGVDNYKCDCKEMDNGDCYYCYQSKEEEQYKKMCDNECGTMLTINTSIMCWSNKEEEKTLCRECYYDCKYYKNDDNEDNAEEIAELKKKVEEEEEEYNPNDCPECAGNCCGNYETQYFKPNMWWVANNGHVKFIKATEEEIEEMGADEWGELKQFTDAQPPK